MNQLAPKSQASYSLTILNGPDKGAVYKIMGGQVSIGRGDSNDIIIKGDPKCSRNHAAVKISNLGIEIYDVSNKNVIDVNGHVASNHYLDHNSVILLGRTKLKFKIDHHEAGPSNTLSPVPPPSNMDLSPSFGDDMEYGGGLDPVQPKKGRRRRSSQKKSSSTFYILLGIIGLFAYILMSDTGKSIKDKVGIRSSEDVSTAINKTEELNHEKIKAFRNKGYDSPQFKAAQSNYIKGRRDYQKGRYDRALVSFQACLGLFPKHELCGRYLRLAKKKKSEMIQYQMILGRKYKEQNQFSSCYAAFRNVMNMEKDSTSTVYKEAKVNAILCQREMEDDF